MQSFLLIKGLQDKLKKAFANFPFREPNDKVEKYREPNIYIGHCPPKKSMPKNPDDKVKEESGEAPFVIIREIEGEIGDKSIGRTHEIKISFLCCVYCKQSYDEIESGYKDIANMRDIILRMLNNEIMFADNTWALEEPLKWNTGLEKAMTSIYESGMQEHPFYGCAVVATFWAAALEKPQIAGVVNKIDN